MAAKIPRSGRRIGDPDRELLWTYPIVSVDDAERIRRKTSSVTYAPIPNDFYLADDLSIALGDFKTLMDIYDTELPLVDNKKYIAQLTAAAERLLQILNSMGERSLAQLSEHGAFRPELAGLGRHPVSAVPSEKLALERRLEALHIASIAAGSDLEGERPAKTYQRDTAIILLADVYEKASGGKAYADDYEDTYFMAFLRAALPLFGVDCPPGYTVKHVLAERRKRIAS